MKITERLFRQLPAIRVHPKWISNGHWLVHRSMVENESDFRSVESAHAALPIITTETGPMCSGVLTDEQVVKMLDKVRKREQSYRMHLHTGVAFGLGPSGAAIFAQPNDGGPLALQSRYVRALDFFNCFWPAEMKSRYDFPAVDSVKDPRVFVMPLRYVLGADDRLVNGFVKLWRAKLYGKHREKPTGARDGLARGPSVDL